MRNAAQVLFPDILAPLGRRAARAGMDDALVGAMLVAADRMARPVAVIDELLRPRRSARLRERLHRLHGGTTDGSSELRGIWFARIAREGFRLMLLLGFAEAVLRRVRIVGHARTNPSCVYAIYHTPWGRVLALWMARRSDSVVFSAQRWLDRAGKAHVPCTWRGLREVVRRIKAGSCAAVTADHFGPRPGHSTIISFLDREVEISTGAARMAAAAGVPLVPVVTRYRHGRVEVVLGPAIVVEESGVGDATRRVAAEFDAELRRDPSSWEQAHRFLSVECPALSARGPALRGGSGARLEHVEALD